MEYLISGMALAISIIFGIKTWNTSNRTNNLQGEVLILTQQAKEFEIRKGQILLMSLLGRYFAIQLNCWEPNGKMKTEKMEIKQYIHELKQLSQDVNDLVTNPFYIEVLEKYSDINLLWISLRRFIIQKEHDQQMSVDPQLFDRFHDLYFKMKDEISDRDIFETEFYIETEKAANFLRDEILKLKQANKP